MNSLAATRTNRTGLKFFSGPVPGESPIFDCLAVLKNHLLVGFVFIWPDSELSQCEQFFPLCPFSKTIGSNCLILQQSEVVPRVGTKKKRWPNNLKGNIGKKWIFIEGFENPQRFLGIYKSHACQGYAQTQRKIHLLEALPKQELEAGVE